MSRSANDFQSAENDPAPEPSSIRHTTSKVEGKGRAGGLTMFAPAQFLTGATMGLLGGYVDSAYSCHAGLLLVGSLATLQILDYTGVVDLPWNPKASPKEGSRGDGGRRGGGGGGLVGFLTANASTAGGFLTGYGVGVVFAMATGASDSDLVDDEEGFKLPQ